MISTPTQPLCPQKERCGSCSWSHIPYEKQLEQKLADINYAFELKELELQCKSILPSPITAHYRNRMDFVISFKGEMGLREKGKWWRTIDNHTCFISDREIERLFHTVRKWVHESGLSFYDRKAHTGFLRYAVIRATKIGLQLVTIVTSPADSEQCGAKLEELGTLIKGSSLVWSINHTESDVSYGSEHRTVTGEGFIEETIAGCTYRIFPNSFFQTNSAAAALLMQKVITAVQSCSPKKVLDLYCGAGFFSVALARAGLPVTGIELSAEMVEEARSNAARNGLNIRFLQGGVEDQSWSEFGADCVILDPPRSGLHDRALKYLIANPPPNIIYVSCNFKNFAREMVELQRLYAVESMQAIDMFPHTPHVELISILKRR